MWSKWQGGRLGAQYSRQQSETASAPFIDHAWHRRLRTLESPQNDAEKLREPGGEVMTWPRLIPLSKEGTTLIVKGCWQCVLLNSKLPSTRSRLFSPCLRTCLPSSTFSPSYASIISLSVSALQVYFLQRWIFLYEENNHCQSALYPYYRLKVSAKFNYLLLTSDIVEKANEKLNDNKLRSPMLNMEILSWYKTIICYTKDNSTTC